MAKAGRLTLVFVPLKKVLSQLPTGAIRMSFGELKQSTTTGVFTDTPSMDQVIIELPLKEVLARVDPAHLTRRPQFQPVWRF